MMLCQQVVLQFCPLRGKIGFQNLGGYQVVAQVLNHPVIARPVAVVRQRNGSGTDEGLPRFRQFTQIMKGCEVAPFFQILFRTGQSSFSLGFLR